MSKKIKIVKKNKNFEYAVPSRCRSKDLFVDKQAKQTGCFDRGICPHCYAFISLLDGFNHDICPACGGEFSITRSVQYICEA